MGDVINIRVTRKQAQRRRQADVAAERRLLHGRSKTDRALAEARADKARRDLEQHRIETGDGQ